MLCFLPDLWKNENLAFATFKDSLFAENRSFILIKLTLTECVYVTVLKK